MQSIKKNNNIKIPNNSIILYSIKKNIITIAGPLDKKSLKLKLKIKILKTKKIIQVLPVPFIKLSNNEKKKINALKGTTIGLIKQLILETSSLLFYNKLKFIGVGYRVFEVENIKTKLLMFKLGYSHFIYHRISKSLNIFCLKSTKLFIYGTSYCGITQAASLVRSYKTPEPYKGKGILYDNEKIKLKKGKKI